MPAAPLQVIPAPPKETPFTDSQGRITLPWLAWLNTLTGLLLTTTAGTMYDPIGSAATAQSAAIAASDPLGAAASALATAEAFSANAANITSGILAAARLPNPAATTLGGVQSISPVASKWLNTISTTGVPTATQPAFSDISGIAGAAQLPVPSATTLGGVQSLAAVASKWINTVSTAGVPSATQPAFTDISGTIASGQVPTLNQNTTGTAANVTGIVAIPNGGTGQSTAAAAVTALGAASLSAANVFYGAATFASATQTQFNVGLNVFNGPANFYGPGAYVQVINGVAATATVPQAGEGFFFAGMYWTGTASAVDQISFSHTIGAGANPYIQLNITHVGSTGFFSVVCPGLQVTTQSFFTGTASFTVAPSFTDQAGTRAALSLVASATTDTTNAANISSGLLPAARLPNPTASTLGGVQSFAVVANQFLTSVTTAGVHVAAQPSFANLSGSATAAQTPLAALLASAQTFAGTQTFTVAPVFTAKAASLTALMPSWTSYTPTVTGGGSMTISSVTITDAQYLTVGPETHFKLFVSFTTGGTVSTSVLISLPVAVAGGSYGALTAMLTTPSLGWAPGAAYANASSATCFQAGSAAFAAGGYNVMISGVYRTT